MTIIVYVCMHMFTYYIYLYVISTIDIHKPSLDKLLGAQQKSAAGEARAQHHQRPECLEG